MDYIKATSNKRYTSPRDCECFISLREIRGKASPTAVEKITGIPGVNWIAVDEEDGDFFIYQFSGYNADLGRFNYSLDRNGNIIS